MTVDKWGISQRCSAFALLFYSLHIQRYPHIHITQKRGGVDLPNILVYTLETRESGESNQHINKHHSMLFLAYPCVERMYD